MVLCRVLSLPELSRLPRIPEIPARSCKPFCVISCPSCPKASAISRSRSPGSADGAGSGYFCHFRAILFFSTIHPAAHPMYNTHVAPDFHCAFWATASSLIRFQPPWKTCARSSPRPRPFARKTRFCSPPRASMSSSRTSSPRHVSPVGRNRLTSRSENSSYSTASSFPPAARRPTTSISPRSPPPTRPIRSLLRSPTRTR